VKLHLRLNMIKALVNSRSEGRWDWKKQLRTFKTTPRPGEYLVLANDNNWYRVDYVVHQAEAEADAPDIIIFAVESSMAMEFTGDLEAVK
jgi:hypothetical protein